MSAPPCRHLEWDSAFFGLPIACVEGNSLDTAHADACLTWCQDQGVACLYFRCEAADQASVAAAERAGFRFVDIRLTLQQQLQGGSLDAGVLVPTSEAIRLAREEDVPALQAIAAHSHHDSRFYADGRFPRSRCDELYRVWIAKECREAANAVWVASVSGEMAGYVTCLLSSPAQGKIGLLSVAQGQQGKGLGAHLLQTACNWFGHQGVETVSVVTQGRNVRAQRAYQKQGFLTARVELWFHRWFVPESP